MNKKVLLILILIIIVLIIALYQFIFVQRNTFGGIKANTTPQTSIFINDTLIGKTPYDDKYKSGEYVLKLIPESSSSEVAAWQGKIQINPSVLTYINRDLGKSELVSAGEILTLEKSNQTQPQITVISQPDAAIILLDGAEKGSSPVTFDVTAGEHDISIASAGFISRTIRIQATAGYKLQINFQLALSGTAPETVIPEASASSSPAPTTQSTSGTPQVLIKDTPTGFLRVRQDPSTAGEELAQIKPGEKYPFVEEKNGWFKIKYSGDKEGWISSKYAQKVQ